VSHLLVTNDFPPKVGGIQSYLWELWRRLPPGEVTVLTTSWPGASAFDDSQPFPIVRWPHRVLFPTEKLAEAVRSLARDAGASLVVLDPVLPLGLVGPRLGLPYAVVVHGAEVAVPGRLPVSHSLLRRVVVGASGVIAAGGYPATELRRAVGDPDLAAIVIPPGVDIDRFVVFGSDERASARSEFGLPPDALVVVSVSRLVPRKGMDVLIDVVARLRRTRPNLELVIAGHGRDATRLSARIRRSGAPARLLGAVGDDALPRLYGCADVFAMMCRDRWLGLEREGFGIVFLEAAACGVPQVGGESGGAGEAIEDGKTGIVVHRPRSHAAVAAALIPLLDDPALRCQMGRRSRERAEREYSYGTLSRQLGMALSRLSR
jgi:phosphatidylinositol alpha-1,6-mannosyltransferase